MRQTNTIVSKRNFLASFNGVTGRFIGYQALANQSGNELTPQTTELSSAENNYTIEQTQRVLGQRLYELSHHLGNVLTVISDRKVGVDTWSYTAQVSANYAIAIGSPNTFVQTTQGTHVQVNGSDGYVDYYTAEIVSSREYSAYGAELPRYSFSDGEYRYGYQSSEKDNEFKGEGNSYTTFFRQLDPRLGRWLSVDPKVRKFPSESPYVSMGNSTILMTDVMGAEKEDWFKDFNGNIVWDEEEGEVGCTIERCINGKVQTLTNIGKTIPNSYFAFSGFYNAMFPSKNRVANYDIYGRHIYTTGDGLYHPIGAENLSQIDQSKLTNDGYYFLVNNSINKSNLANLVMSSFLNGDGPENFVIPDGHEASYQFLSSNLFFKAVKDFWENQPLGISNTSELVSWGNHYSQDKTDVIPQILLSSSIKNVRNLIGGAYVTITPKPVLGKPNEVELHFKVWNTISMTSGSTSKSNYSAPRPYNVFLGAAQPYTNVGMELQTSTIIGGLDKFFKK